MRIHPNPAANWPGIRNVVLLHNAYARRRLLVKLRFHGRCYFVQDQITYRLEESTGYLSQIHRCVPAPGTEWRADTARVHLLPEFAERYRQYCHLTLGHWRQGRVGIDPRLTN